MDVPAHEALCKSTEGAAYAAATATAARSDCNHTAPIFRGVEGQNPGATAPYRSPRASNASEGARIAGRSGEHAAKQPNPRWDTLNSPTHADSALHPTDSSLELIYAGCGDARQKRHSVIRSRACWAWRGSDSERMRGAATDAAAIRSADDAAAVPAVRWPAPGRPPRPRARALSGGVCV